MSAPVVGWALPALAVGGSLLFLAAWEAESTRRLREEPGRGTARRASIMVHLAQEVRAAAWFFTALWVFAFLRGHGPGTERTLSAETWPAAGALLAWFLIPVGWFLGAHTSFPAWLRWTLAPFHGLSMWLLWSISRLRDRPVREPGEGEEAEEEEEGPEGPARRGVAELATLPVGGFMIPRSQVVALEAKFSVRAAVGEIRKYPHGLYPVYDETIDSPLGMVRILDLALAGDAEGPVRDLVRPAPIVPETMKGLTLLGDLCGAPTPAALVVDEFGGTAGLVTVEDLVEVLVGDLVGEHEMVRSRITPLGPGRTRVEGACSVEEFNAWFGPVVPEGRYETVAGFILDRLGRIPQAGERLEIGGLRLEVVERTERRVLWISVAGTPPGGSSRSAGPRPPGSPAPRG